jgi:type IV pilus assembly protein PilN
MLSVVFLLLVSSYFYIDFTNTIKSLREEQTAKQKELDSFKETNKRLVALKKIIADVELKLNTIKRLEKIKTGPVRLLDDIAMSVPKNKLWLTALKEQGGTLILNGTAMDNETVADFMDSLGNTQSINSVQLVRTMQKKIPGFDLSLKDFSLSSKTYTFKEKVPPQTEKKK